MPLPVNVVLSYSHMDHSLRKELAAQLAPLRRGGLIRDWSDQEISPGEERRITIEEHMREADVILLLISADFLASDYCHDVEVALALQRGSRGEVDLIPIILRDCDWSRTPLSEYQVLPQGGKPVTSWTNRDEAWADVVRGIRRAVARLSGAAAVGRHAGTSAPAAASLERAGQAGGAPRLRPDHPWGTFVEEKTVDFVGREHVFAAIDTFFARHRKGYFTIEGDPGVGKTSLIAEYVKRTGCEAHFNIAAQGITRFSSFYDGIRGQLARRFGRGSQTGAGGGSESDGQALAELIDACARELPADERFVVAVDALDEVHLESQSSGSNVLYLPTTLPDRVYFIVTRRPTPLPWRIEAPEHVLDLMRYGDANLEDARRYVTDTARRPQIQRWLASMSLSTSKFADVLANKSEGNFMYLRYVVLEIEKGTYGDRKLDDLPQGLLGYYEDHWRRMGMMSATPPRDRARIVYVLAGAQKPVTRDLLARMAGVDQGTAQSVLDDWRQFVHRRVDGNQTIYSIYHASFRDFLDRKEVVQAFGMKNAEVHQQIVDGLGSLVSKYLKG